MPMAATRSRSPICAGWRRPASATSSTVGATSDRTAASVPAQSADRERGAAHGVRGDQDLQAAGRRRAAPERERVAYEELQCAQGADRIAGVASEARRPAAARPRKERKMTLQETTGTQTRRAKKVQ